MMQDLAAIEIALDDKSGKRGLNIFQGESLRFFLLLRGTESTEKTNSRQRFRKRWRQMKGLRFEVEMRRRTETGHREIATAMNIESPILDSHVTLSTNGNAVTREGQLIECPADLADAWDIVYALETPVCIQPELVGCEVELVVTLSTSALLGSSIFDEILSSESNNHQSSVTTLYDMSRAASMDIAKREARKVVRILEPLHVASTSTILGGISIISLQVGNSHSELPLLLEDVQLHLSSTIAEGHGELGQQLERAFRSEIVARCFPLALSPAEVHCFVLRIVPRPGAAAAAAKQELQRCLPPGGYNGGAHGATRCHSLLTLAHRVDGVSSSLVGRYHLAWTPPALTSHGLTLVLRGDSPVRTSEPFDVTVVVCNLSRQRRELTLLLAPTSAANTHLVGPAADADADASGAHGAHGLSPVDAVVAELGAGWRESAEGRAAVSVAHAEEQEQGLIDATVLSPLGVVEGAGARTVRLRFVPLRAGRLEISNILLYDAHTKQYFKQAEPFVVVATDSA